MIPFPTRARQPHRDPWSHERLVHERAIALGHAVDRSTIRSYSSALNSYLEFVKNHNYPVEPTPDTLSLFTVYMSHHISPRSVNNYLSGIVHQLEPHFPDVRAARSSRLVQRTLRGCMKMLSKPTKRKQPLSIDDLHRVINHYQNPSHDDLLFLAMLITGFCALMRLGELSFPDNASIRDWRKITRRSSIILSNKHYEFTLPSHKADSLFEGNKIMILKNQFGIQPHHHFHRYLESRDTKMSLASPLWLTAAGLVPTRAFFIQRLRLFFPNDISGQSMRAGGATKMAEEGAAPLTIQSAGRWSSDAFKIYIRKNPAVLHGMMFSQNRGQHGPRP